ncbi:hypothetical protein H5410_004338 [Solanum commersonii]|uniref:Uncharacterized protein n=1 Tax=Solanum commersonii TaxID=4109 RepID=A0A9J6B744_SOLCO|nr:hypothetical protein H5410_004338 [Solanum commersonii]
MKKGLISKSEAINLYGVILTKMKMHMWEAIALARRPDDGKKTETILKRYQQQLEESSSAQI